VQASWFTELGEPLIEFSAPLSHPPVHYHQTEDQIKCFVTPSFGPYAWSLPNHEMALPTGLEKYKVLVNRPFTQILVLCKIFVRRRSIPKVERISGNLEYWEKLIV
jgi:hypothetical protein